MSLYPFNTNVARQAQSDAPAVKTDLLSVVHRRIGSPAISDDDYFVASVNMQVGAYTLLHTAMPEAGVARALLITVTQVGGVNDTMGTLDVVGTDQNGQALSETVVPTANSTKTTLNAFKTVTSITGAGWSRNAGAGSEDTIKIGTSEILGLPDKLANNTVLVTCLNNVREGTAPTVTHDSAVLAKNTIDLNSALGGTPVDVYYVV